MRTVELPAIVHTISLGSSAGAPGNVGTVPTTGTGSFFAPPARLASQV